MVSFFLCIAALILGYVFYGRFVEKVFGADETKATPAMEMNDGNKPKIGDILEIVDPITANFREGEHVKCVGFDSPCIMIETIDNMSYGKGAKFSWYPNRMILAVVTEEDEFWKEVRSFEN